jgi:hypothetical protein
LIAPTTQSHTSRRLSLALTLFWLTRPTSVTATIWALLLKKGGNSVAPSVNGNAGDATLYTANLNYTNGG